MGRPGLARFLSAVGLGAGLCAGCAHRQPPGPVPAPPPDGMAAWCAKIDAPATVLASGRQLALLSPDNPAGQEAEFDLGLAYYCLGLYAEAAATFDPNAPAPATPARMGREIDRAMAGASGEERTRIAHAPTLRLLASLHRRFPRWQGAEDAVAACAPASYDVPALADVRDELLYMAARSAYSAGDFPRALDLFGRIPARSAHHVQAKLIEGAVHVRRYDAKPAVTAFGEALRAATIGVGPDAVRFRDLANLSLARTFYSTGQFDLAAKYYRMIPRESLYWRERLFEAGWTDFMRGDHAAALRAVAALRAETSAVAPELMGDATLLESAAAQTIGDGARAAAALASFNATYPVLFTELKAFLAANPDDGALYARVAAFRRGKSDLPPALEGVVRRLLADGWLARRFDDVDELTRELALYERLPPAWRADEYAPSVAADLTARLSAAITEAGSTCRRRIKRVSEELAQQIKRTISIPYEPLNATLVR